MTARVYVADGSIAQVVSSPSNLGQTIVSDRITSTDDSDYTITVGAGKVRRYHHLAAQLNCTATVGNRYLWIAAYNQAGNQLLMYQTAVITANQIAVLVLGQDEAWSTTARFRISGTTAPNVQLSAPIPDLFLTAGSYIRIWDSGAIDPAADDLYIFQVYEEWDA